MFDLVSFQSKCGLAGCGVHSTKSGGKAGQLFLKRRTVIPEPLRFTVAHPEVNLKVGWQRHVEHHEGKIFICHQNQNPEHIVALNLVSAFRDKLALSASSAVSDASSDHVSPDLRPRVFGSQLPHRASGGVHHELNARGLYSLFCILAGYPIGRFLRDCREAAASKPTVADGQHTRTSKLV
jgi:hypothetical protein